jgi:hypothetical protein
MTISPAEVHRTLIGTIDKKPALKFLYRTKSKETYTREERLLMDFIIEAFETGKFDG